MATVDRVRRSPAAIAASRALDADIEASLEGREPHPDGTVFIPQDLASTELIESYRREGSFVAVVSETDAIDLHRPRLKTDEKLVLTALLSAALLFWLTRPRVPA
jgi:hypothetical protein